MIVLYFKLSISQKFQGFTGMNLSIICWLIIIVILINIICQGILNIAFSLIKNIDQIIP
jgi:hypothetical protein